MLGARRRPDLTPHATLFSLSAADLLATDRALRRAYRDINNTRSGHLSTSLPVREDARDDVETYLFVAACNANGYVRERALVAFRKYPGSLALVIALIRLDEWVPEVCGAAIALYKKALGIVSPSELTANLELVWRISRRERVVAHLWAKEIKPRLVSPENRASLYAAARNQANSCAARVFAYELLLKAPSSSAQEVLSNAIADPHPAVARWALARFEGDAADSRSLIASALKHPYAAIRVLALRRYDGADRQQALLDALLDGSAAVRRLAASELSKHFEIEARTIWRNAARAGAKTAVLALCEFGEREDVELLKQFARHPTAAVRSRVLHALAKLGAADVNTYLVLALNDSSKTVVRQAIELYRRDMYFLDADTLLQALHIASDQTRGVLITAVHALDKWQALRVLLRRRIDGDEHAREETRQWFDRSSNRFTTLPDDLRAELMRLLEMARFKDPDFDPRFLLEILRLS